MWQKFREDKTADYAARSNGKSGLMECESRHQCLIYEGAPSQQLPAFAAMIKRKLDEGHRCLYLNSRPMVAGIRSYLAAIGIDVETDLATSRLVLSSESIASANGGFDGDVMLAKLEGALEQALSDGYKGLWASGDMTWEFGSEKNFAKLMEYEYRLEELICRRQELCGICQYHQDTLPREVTRQALLTHRMIFINETLSRANPHYVPSGLSTEQPATSPGLDASQYPNELLRKKLVVAGIPESEQSMQSLAARMPGDFNAQSFEGMSADTMAELLLYFIAKGLVTLPVACDKALLDMPWGSHVCQFYNSKEDQIKMLVPYFKQGLEKNDACVWLVGDLTVEEARNALAAAVPGLEHYMAKGQMQIRHYSEFYTNPDGTVKPADALRDQFAEMGSTVRAKGFRGLRASGSVSWIDDDDAMSRFMDYETKVHCAIQDSRMMAVCTYPARAAALHRSRELIHNHGKIFVKRGEWVHDKSRDAKKIEEVFASLATM